jgi:hypothetical protein
LRTDHAKERNAKDKVLSVNVGWQLEARSGAQQAVPAGALASPERRGSAAFGHILKIY